VVLVRRALIALVFLYGLTRFLSSALLPALQRLTGDFSAAFPSGALIWLRPDFPRTNVIGDTAGMWNYGPVMHAVTLPLFLAPTWSAVAPLWAVMNLLMLAACFAGLVGLVPGRASLTYGSLALLATMWLLFQPLATCFAQGNIEIAELLMLVLAFRLMAAGRFDAASVWVGVAVMTKFLPAGFIGWLVLKRRWRAAAVGTATMLVIAVITAFTLGWSRSVTLGESAPLAVGSNMSGFLDGGVPSIYFHRTAVPDWSATLLNWFPEERMKVAANAGRVASAMMGIVFTCLLARRRPGALRDELGVLCLLMFLVAPWDHDYYYIFALVPLTLLAGEALEVRDGTTLTLIGVAYCLMSPPIPYAWVTRAHVVKPPFAYWMGAHDIPTAGALLLLVLLTTRLLRPAPAD
jgi:hypothetical protein